MTDRIEPRPTIGTRLDENSKSRLLDWVVGAQAAAEAGDPDAQLRLAGLLFRGHGMQRNVTEAIHWYERAAEQGESEAAYNLAVIYQYGLGIAANRTQADLWYGQAAKSPGSAASLPVESANSGDPGFQDR